MPTTVVGFLVFVALLAPGLAFTARRETRFIPRQTSVLRETGTVVVASVLADLIVLGLFAGWRTIAPSMAPDVGALLRDPGAYFDTHYREVIGWGVSVVAAATAGAFILAVPPAPLVTVWQRLPRWAQPTWLEELGNPIVYRSAWDRLMKLRPDDPSLEASDERWTVWVSAELQDGTYVSGPLYSLNPDVDEDSDREIILKAPIKMRAPSLDEEEEVDFGAITLSSRYLKYVAFTYVERSSL